MLLTLHLFTFIGMSINRWKGISIELRDGPMILIVPMYIGYITLVSTKIANFLVNPVLDNMIKNENIRL